MPVYIFPFIGLAVGVMSAIGGFGGGFIVVPILLWLGFSKEMDIGTGFLKVFAVALASLIYYGAKGAVDWKAGILLAIGSATGAYLGAHFIQPHISEKFFRYILAVILIGAAVSLVLKK